MQPLRVSQDFLTVADFKAKVSEVVRDLKEQRRTQVVITHQGTPAAVMISPEEYDRLTYHERFITAVQSGLADLEAGRVVAHEDVVKETETWWATEGAEED